MRRRRSPTSTLRIDCDGGAEILSFVLLIGITITSITALVVVGSQAIADARQTAHVEHAENSLTSLDATATTVAHGDSPSQTIDLGLADLDDGARLTGTDSGRLTLTATNGTELLNQSLGTITYRSGETTIAYQAGGVWRKQADGGSVMISPPELEYRKSTLTLPLVVVEPVEQGFGSSQLTLRQQGTPVPFTKHHLDNERITITVQSEYYLAWAAFFEQRFGTDHVTVNHAGQRVSADLGHQSAAELPRFEYAVLSLHNELIMGEGGTVNGDIASTGGIIHEEDSTVTGDSHENIDLDATALDETIREKVNASDTPVNETELGAGELTAGTYYDPDGAKLSDSDELVLNVESGDITLVVDGDLRLEEGGSIRVKNPDQGSVRVFLTGNLKIEGENSGVRVPDDDASRFIVYAMSDSWFTIEGEGATFVGGFYAPQIPATNPTPQNVQQCHPEQAICIEEGATVHGGIVGGDAKIEEGATVTYDPRLEDVTVDLQSGEANATFSELRFLYYSATAVEVKQEY